MQIRAAATLEQRRRNAGKSALIWAPESDPQRLALESFADELLYGGQAGGGKTDLLLGCAILNHQRSIIFRREYPQAEAIMDRSEELLFDVGRWNGVQHRWRLGKRKIIRIGAMQKRTDWRKWRGQPFDFIGFDEGAEFVKEQFQSLIAWNRSVEKNQRCRVIVASNPPSSVEGDWVIDCWAPWLDEEHADYPARPGQLRYFASIDGEEVEVKSDAPISHNGEMIYPRSRTFIPASLDDNPYLRDDTQYRSGLQNLPEPLRSQLLFGDFTIGREPDDWQVIPTIWIKLAQARWRQQNKPAIPMSALGVDPARGGKDQTVIAARYGNWFDKLKKYPGTKTPDGDKVADLIMAALLGSKALINIDVIGIGASPYDTLKRNRVRVNAINFAEKSDATDRTGELAFANLRAEGYWKFRESLDPDKGDDIALPPDSELLRDLCAPRWKITARGIQIESKQDLLKRLGRSPDCGDAVVMALMTPTRSLLGIVAQGKAKGW